MLQEQGSFLDRLAFGRVMRRWRSALERAPDLAGPELAGLGQQAQSMARATGAVIDAVNGQTEARFNPAQGIERPLGCDWAWRPQVMAQPVRPAFQTEAGSGSRLGQDMTLFHDCPNRQIALRQIANRGQSPAPFGAELEVFGFEGSFLSLVLDLPEEAVQGFRLHHLVQLDITLSMEVQRPVYCRFNIQHGPNSDQLVGQMPEGGGMVHFDLAYTKLNEKRLEKAWIDLIFEAPAMNRITLQDLTVLRYPRADL